MTADPEAVTRTLAAHRLAVILVNDLTDGWKWTCRCGEESDGLKRNRLARDASEAHLASVLASLPDDRLARCEHGITLADLCAAAEYRANLPDDRLAEAEADHNLLIEADSCLSYVRHRRASSLTDDDRREMDSLLSRLRPRTDAIIRERRAALSGGDAT